MQEAIRQAFRCWWPVFLATWCLSLLVGIGLLFLVVPGIILFFRLLFTDLLVVAERLPVSAALRRSQALTANQHVRGSTGAAVLLVYIVGVAAALASGYLGPFQDLAVYGVQPLFFRFAEVVAVCGYRLAVAPPMETEPIP